jgi:hypothetical protein
VTNIIVSLKKERRGTTDKASGKELLQLEKDVLQQFAELVPSLTEHRRIAPSEGIGSARKTTTSLLSLLLDEVAKKNLSLSYGVLICKILHN